MRQQPRKHSPGSIRRAAKTAGYFFAGIAIAVVVLLVIEYRIQHAPEQKPLLFQSESAAFFAPMYTAFKAYANESAGEMYPPCDSRPGYFLPDMEALGEYLSDTAEGRGAKNYLAGNSGVQVCYLGFALSNEDQAIKLLDEIERQGWEATRQREVQFEGVSSAADADKLGLRLREGIERFFITDIGNPVASPMWQSSLPILWELPNETDRKGGWVLYMDGTTEWMPYPGDFPMTAALISRLREMYVPVETPQDNNTPAQPSTPTLTDRVDTTFAVHADSPVHALAQKVVDVFSGQLHPMRRREAFRAIHCDGTPSVVTPHAKGYRFLLRQTKRHYLENKQDLSMFTIHGLEDDTPIAGPALEEITYVDCELFPMESDVAPKTRKRIPWIDLPQSREPEPVYMGTGHGYHWFGRMSIPSQERLRHALKLSGGDDRLDLLTDFIKHVRDDTERTDAIHLLSNMGESALPILESISRDPGDTGQIAAIQALGNIPGQATTEMLLQLARSARPADKYKYVSSVVEEQLLYHYPGPHLKDFYVGLLEETDNPYTVQRITNLAVEYNWPDFKRAYVHLLRQRKHMTPCSEAARHFGWTDAVPLLEAYLEKPTSIDDYRAAFLTVRILDNDPLPPKLREALDMIEDMYPYIPSEFQSWDDFEQGLARAKTLIAECDDQDAAVTIAVLLALDQRKTRTKSNYKLAAAVARELVLEFPETLTAPLLRRLEEHIELEYEYDRTKEDIQDLLAQIGAEPEIAS